MAYLGTVLEFSSDQETWTAYVEHLVQYLNAQLQLVVATGKGPSLLGRLAYKYSLGLD